MKRKLFLLSMLVVIGLSMKAQSWEWANGATNSLDDEGSGIASDVNGNVYATGYFSDATLSFGANMLTNTSGSNNYFNMYIVKYNPSGNVVWAKNGGGTDGDCKALSIANGPNGTSYVTGYFYCTSLVIDTITIANPSNNQKIFIAKFDSLGNVMWAKSPTGTYIGSGNGIAADTAGNAYVTGTFASGIDFGNGTLTSAGGTDIFVAKYNSAGINQWSIRQGSTGNEGGNSISLDGINNIYVTGNFGSTSLQLGINTLTNDMNNSTNDIFVEKLLNNAGAVVWAASGKGDNDDEAKGIGTDALGNSYVTGFFNSDSLMFGSVVLHSYLAGSNCFYVVKYNSTGIPQWAQRAGVANYNTNGYSVKTDNQSNAYVTGSYQGSPSVSFGNFVLVDSSNGSGNIFVVKYSSAGTVSWAKNAGGSSSDRGAGIATDATGNGQYVTGYYNSNPAHFGTYSLANPNLYPSVFVAKLGITVGLETIERGENKISIYPNSNNGIFTVSYHLMEAKSVFRMEDAAGRILAQKNIDATDGKQTIDATNLSNGIYFWEVISGNNPVLRGKVEIIK